MNNKIYVVFEDVCEAYVFNVGRIFRGAFFKEEDAQALVDELSNDYDYSDFYYEEVLIK